MSLVKRLIAALEKCVPEFDPAPLLADLPENAEEETVLYWLAEHLEKQQLMVYFEWKEYTGKIPNLKPLKPLDLSACNADFITDLIYETPPENLPWDIPYELPYLEYFNDALKPHGLRLVTFAYENAYVLCVNDDEASLDALAASLKEFGIMLIQNEAMSKDEILACVADDGENFN
ncbi:MAG: hypothetical protein LBO72_06085 [Helicobacteraceae bacterium]|jgi:hypothetical protein|nr:hypothetical protein [Helicobacteraceae bacterium]